MTKEDFFEKEISPLLDKIIDLCKNYGLNIITVVDSSSNPNISKLNSMRHLDNNQQKINDRMLFIWMILDTEFVLRLPAEIKRKLIMDNLERLLSEKDKEEILRVEFRENERMDEDREEIVVEEPVEAEETAQENENEDEDD